MNRTPLVIAGIFLGIGMGGFVDGIVFHQILQIHNMLSAKVPVNSLVNAEINMVWDGIFHAMTWLMTALGLFTLWNAGKNRDVPWSGRTLWGGLWLGWGLFNFVEGIIDHHILEIHHVVEKLGVSIYDYFFLVSGLIFIIFGMSSIFSGRQDTIRKNPSPIEH